MIILKRKPDEFSIPFNEGELKEGFYYVFLGISSIVTVDASEFTRIRDIQGWLLSVHLAKLEDMLGLVYKSSKSCTVISSGFSKNLIPPEDAEVIIDDVSEPILVTMGRYNAEAKYLCDKYQAKRDILLMINPVDSLVALESQLDLLTYVVLFLLTKLPDNEKPEWFKLITDSITDVSSLSLTPYEDLLKSTLSYKEFVRNKQKQYLDIKTKANDSAQA